MIHPQPDRPALTFLFSDTGGGHRSACEAIIEAINLEFPGQFDCRMVDIFRQYAPKPLDRAPDIYPPLSRMPDVWRFGYRLSDNQPRARTLNRLIWPYVRRALARLVAENPCDLFVSVHGMSNAPVVRALRGRTPLVTVVTDMVTTHVAWYTKGARLVLVPTEAARQRGIDLGLNPGQIEVVGMPVAERFCQPVGDKTALRSRLGWEGDKPVILLVGGGEGMGPLERTARAINDARLDAVAVIICGRNRSLRQRLERLDWNIPAYTYGFVREMPDFMRAADILVTKAGPGTISEAFIAGLPLVLYSRMPGQEEGNVDYVVNEGAGVWAPSPDEVVSTLYAWLERPEERRRVAQASLNLARPGSSRLIARLLAAQVGIKK